MQKKAIVWFRNDLRLRDNVVLHEALKRYDQVIPVYCFDNRQFQCSTLGIPETGYFRASFLIECVASLRKEFRSLGTDLVVRYGKPEVAVSNLATELEVQAVFASKEVGNEEVAVEIVLERRLLKNNIALELFWQSTLFHVEDIPWPIKNVPDVFAQFRKEAEKTTPLRQSVDAPVSMNPIGSQQVLLGEIPSMAYLGFSDQQTRDARSVLYFEGGETAGMKRLHQYLWETDHIATYKETRNGMVGEAYSSKLSAWLSRGCISPRVVYEEIKKYEKARTENQSTYWLFIELLWRDFFRFTAKKHGDKLFLKGGIQEKDVDLNDDHAKFERWKEAKTGIPFVDANMREINATGFMSNRGRQNVASFLINDLKVNWTWGAYYFESMLIDYDVASNWGNWNYLAGVGNDPRENRYFNIISQACRYDPQGAYVRQWIPELADIPGKKIHYPEAAITHAHHYPEPMVGFNKWVY